MIDHLAVSDQSSSSKHNKRSGKVEHLMPLTVNKQGHFATKGANTICGDTLNFFRFLETKRKCDSSVKIARQVKCINFKCIQPICGSEVGLPRQCLRNIQ